MGFLSYPTDLSKVDKKVGHKEMYSWRSINYFTGLLKLNRVEFKGIMFKPLPNKMMDEYFSNNLDTFIEIGEKLGVQACAYILVVFKNIS